MAKGPSRKLCGTCIVLLSIFLAVAVFYLYHSVPRIMLAPWLLSDGGFASVFGF